MTLSDGLTGSLATVLLACLLSYLGSLLGLLALERAAVRRARRRLRFLALAAFGFGVTGVWAAYLTATLGLRYRGVGFLYSAPRLLIGCAATFLITILALVIAGGFRQRRAVGIIMLAAVFTAASRLAMTAPRLALTLSQNAVSVGIAIAVALAAAWANTVPAASVRPRWSTFASAIALPGALATVYGVSLADVAVHLNGQQTGQVSGASAGSLLLPLIIIVACVTLVALLLLGIGPTRGEQNAEENIATLQARLVAGSERGRFQ